jgi:hypothetical protein
MKKKLPQIYVNEITKKLNNNKNLYYSAAKLTGNDITNEHIEENVSIEEKIINMFNSPNYVYKIGATIFTKDGKKHKKEIIGQIADKLITIDDEYIDIESINNILY